MADLDGLDGMDRALLTDIQKRFPRSSIYLARFFSGTQLQWCGFVPNDWDRRTRIITWPKHLFKVTKLAPPFSIQAEQMRTCAQPPYSEQ